VEDYPDGVLHEPGMFIKDDVDDVAGTYWVAYASMAPADPFDGSGIAFDIATMERWLYVPYPLNTRRYQF